MPPASPSSDPVLIHAANAADAERRYGIPASVILGLLKQEGGTSPDGKPVRPADHAGPPSYGQFTFDTGRSLGIRYGDSRSEVFGVARYLKQLGWDRDPDRALGAYNGGPGNPQMSYAAKVRTLARNYTGFDGGHNPITQPATRPASTSTSSSGRLVSGEQHSTLVRFGVQAALVLAAAIGVAVGVARLAGVRNPAELTGAKA